MAKLSAHGTELARVEYSYAVPPERSAYSDGTPCENPVVSERVCRSYRSDGHIMRRYVTTWADGMTHDYGWKLYRKMKPEIRKDRDKVRMTVKLLIDDARKFAEKHPERTYDIKVYI